MILTMLQRSIAESEETNLESAREIPAPSMAADKTASERGRQSKILRFAKSERILHWSIAGPFLVSFTTGILLVLVYNPDPSRPFRGLLAAVHFAVVGETTQHSHLLLRRGSR